jgi:peptidoglycan/xylan/chitin deacetylase (PgdA/CDA1 family)
VVRLDELFEPPTARGSDRPIVAITFDDGYADNHAHALPALTELALPATFFITTGLVEGDDTTVDRLRRVWGPEMRDVRGLTWRQIDEMRSEGMTFGAHTRTHPNLRDLPDDVVHDEIASSRDALEDRIGEPVTLFAYPFGDARFHLSEATMRVAGDLGLATAFTVEYRGVSRHEDPMRVPRFPVSNDPPNILRAKVDGRLDLIGTWRERAPAWVTTRVSSGRARAAASR